MPESITVAGVLLVVGPILGAIPVANPSLFRVWSASRDEHLATIGAHRLAWTLLNLGFGFATIATAAGLAILALAAEPDQYPRGVAGRRRAGVWLRGRAVVCGPGHPGSHDPRPR